MLGIARPGCATHVRMSVICYDKEPEWFTISALRKGRPWLHLVRNKNRHNVTQCTYIERETSLYKTKHLPHVAATLMSLNSESCCAGLDWSLRLELSARGEIGIHPDRKSRDPALGGIPIH